MQSPIVNNMQSPSTNPYPQQVAYPQPVMYMPGPMYPPTEFMAHGHSMYGPPQDMYSAEASMYTPTPSTGHMQSAAPMYTPSVPQGHISLIPGFIPDSLHQKNPPASPTLVPTTSPTLVPTSPTFVPATSPTSASVTSGKSSVIYSDPMAQPIDSSSEDDDQRFPPYQVVQNQL